LFWSFYLLGAPALTDAHFLSTCVRSVTAFPGKRPYSRAQKNSKTGEWTMRLFIALAIIISATVGLGGCFGHHEKAVTHEPLKLG